MSYNPAAFPGSFRTASHHDLAASGLSAAQAKKSRRLPVEWREGDRSTHQFKLVKRQAGMRREVIITEDDITIGKL